MQRNYNEFYYTGAVSTERCDPYNHVGSTIVAEAPVPIDLAISHMVRDILSEIEQYEADVLELGADIVSQY